MGGYGRLWTRGSPPNFVYFTFIIETLGGSLPCLPQLLFYLLLFSKIIKNNNNIIIYIYIYRRKPISFRTNSPTNRFFLRTNSTKNRFFLPHGQTLGFFLLFMIKYKKQQTTNILIYTLNSQEVCLDLNLTKSIKECRRCRVPTKLFSLSLCILWGVSYTAYTPYTFFFYSLQK